MHNDFCNLIEKIHKVAEKLETEGTDQNERLNTFEQRIMDIKISDADQFFLNKEIMRFRNLLEGIGFTRDIHFEAAQDIENGVRDETHAITQESLDLLRNGLK